MCYIQSSFAQYQNSQSLTEMELQIRKALDQIVHSFDADNMNFYKHLRESLEAILTVLHEQHEAMKEAHATQVCRLQATILEKQLEIQTLKLGRQQKNQPRTLKNEPATPYRILLKSGKKNNTNLNKENMLKEQPSLVEQAFAGINISEKKPCRFSLQIGPSAGKTSRGSSSNIKNKIMNQRQDKIRSALSPRPFGQENQLISYASNFNKPGENTHRQSLADKVSPRLENREEYAGLIYEKEERNCEMDSKRSSIQDKVKLCRKPSTKSKRELLRKKQFSNSETNRIRCVDVTIPIKTINVMAIKPR